MADIPATDRNLLIALLAFQNNFIDRPALLAAFAAWTEYKSRPIAELLVEQQKLTPPQRELIEALAAEHLKQHANDPLQSLAALSSVESGRAALASLADHDLQQSLVHLRRSANEETTPLGTSDRAADPDRTLSFGATTSTGQRFRILRPHAEGGLGKVSVARDEELNREVALKEIKPKYADEPSARARFTLEAEITGGLEHPGIVPVYGLGTYADGRPYYAMRFIRGDSLKDAIDTFFQKYKPTNHNDEEDIKLPAAAYQSLEFRKLLQRFVDVCNAIAYAHARGVLHRDLKPGNIMLGKYGETLVVDWGLAKATGKPDASVETSQAPLAPSNSGEANSGSVETAMGLALGTIGYMSPEQAAGRVDQLGPATDIYLLGATLYHILTGHPPHRGKDQGQILKRIQEQSADNPREVNSGIPAALAAISLKAMAIKSVDRYAVPLALGNDVEKWLADEPIAAVAETVLSRASRWTRRNRHWVNAGGVALLLITATVIGAYLYQRNTSARNLELAEERGKLLTEKTALLTDITRQSESLRVEVAKRLFAGGVADYNSGNLESGTREVQRAWNLLRADDELKKQYLEVLLEFSQRNGRSLGIPMWHEGPVKAVAFDPRGTRIATGSADKTAWIWDGYTGEPLVGPLPHHSTVRCVVFSHDGNRLFTASENDVRFWDAATGELLATPIQHQDSILALAVSPDGTKILTGSRDQTFALWDAATGAAIRQSQNRSAPVVAVGFRPCGTQFFTASAKTISLWSTATGDQIGAPLVNSHDITAATFSPVGDKLLVCKHGGGAVIWDVDIEKQIYDISSYGRDSSHYAIIAPDVSYFLIGRDRNRAELLFRTPFNNHNGDYEIAHQGSITSVGITNSGDRIVTGSDDGCARIWNAERRFPLEDPHMWRDYTSGDASFDSTGSRFLTVLTTNKQSFGRLWDARQALPIGNPIFFSGPIDEFKFNARGDRLMTRTKNTAQLWNADTGTAIGKEFPAADTIVIFSPNGRYVLAANSDHSIAVRDSTAGEIVAETPAHTDKISSIRFDADSVYFLLSSAAFVRLYDMRTGRPISDAIEHPDHVRTAVLSPDGKHIVTLSGSMMFVWESSTVKLIRNVNVGADVKYVRFLNTGVEVAAVGADSIQFWDIRTGIATRKTIFLGTSPRVSFSSEGDYILVVNRSHDSSIAQLWSTANSQVSGMPIAMHSGWTIDPGWRRVATTELTKGITFFDLHTGSCVGRSPWNVFNGLTYFPNGQSSVSRSNNGFEIWHTPRATSPRNVETYLSLVTRFRPDENGEMQKVLQNDWVGPRRQFNETDREWFEQTRTDAAERYRQGLILKLRTAVADHDAFRARHYRANLTSVPANLEFDCDQMLERADGFRSNLAYRPSGSMFPKVTASHTGPQDDVADVVNGIVNFEKLGFDRWTAFQSKTSTDWLEIEFENRTTLSRLDLAIYREGDGGTPGSYLVETWNDSNWEQPKQTKSPADPRGNAWNEVQFSPAVTTKKVRIVFTHSSQGKSGVTEIAIWP